MKLNYIDIDETPVSITFIADEIKVINSFLELHKAQVESFNRSALMEDMANKFAEITARLSTED